MGLCGAKVGPGRENAGYEYSISVEVSNGAVRRPSKEDKRLSNTKEAKELNANPVRSKNGNPNFGDAKVVKTPNEDLGDRNIVKTSNEGGERSAAWNTVKILENPSSDHNSTCDRNVSKNLTHITEEHMTSKANETSEHEIPETMKTPPGNDCARSSRGRRRWKRFNQPLSDIDAYGQGVPLEGSDQVVEFRRMRNRLANAKSALGETLPRNFGQTNQDQLDQKNARPGSGNKSDQLP